MSARLEELDWQSTPMGEISLRRRREPSLDLDVYEVRLGDEFLMSSLFTVAEIELARLGVAAVRLGMAAERLGMAAELGNDLDVLVGGLGLGYTARGVLESPRVRSLVVVEALTAVIDWHQREPLPLARELTADPRTRLVQGDFFALVAATGSAGVQRTTAGGDLGFGRDRWHAILVDIDHTPRHVLHPSHAAFYTTEGLRRLARLLHNGGVFGLWSDDPPDDDFVALLEGVFDTVEARVVTFANHYTGSRSANTVYLSSRQSGRQV